MNNQITGQQQDAPAFRAGAFKELTNSFSPIQLPYPSLRLPHLRLNFPHIRLKTVTFTFEGYSVGIATL